MDDFQIGYFAGIIDGEGCIYVNRAKPTGRRKTPGYGVKLCITNTSYALVEWLKTHARLTSIYYEESPGGNRKPKWNCTWNNSAAHWALTLTKPYLVIKRDQAVLGLELLEHMHKQLERRGVCVSTEDVAYRESIKRQVSLLNKRGRLEPTPPIGV